MKTSATLLLCTVLAAGCRKPHQQIRVAAASDLSLAFKELGAAFEKRTGNAVVFTFGSTGLMAKQIAEGAPYDLFAAANVSYVDELVKEGACSAASKAIYARGHVVVWTAAGDAAPPAQLADLAQPRFRKISIANPDHAPYGQAAREALQHAGLWSALQPKLVFGENVQQALQFAQTGNADAALVSQSLASVSGGQMLHIDETLYAPIDQALVLCGKGATSPPAQQLVRFITSVEARETLQRYGFTVGSTTTTHAR